MHALLVRFGRHGDAHPSLAPGRAPRARGHRVTLLINGDFGPLVRRIGFEAAPPGEARHFEQALRDPDLRHPRRGPDCGRGATVRVRGRLWFAEWGDLDAELRRIERTGWRGPTQPDRGRRTCRGPRVS